MDQKKSPNRRSKRQCKLAEDCYWDCSVCTYRNTAEAFKCLMCDIRKGTSTRKPRINPQLVAQQVAQQYTQSVPKVRKEESPVSRTELGMIVGPTLPPPPLPNLTSIPGVVLPPKPELRAEKKNGAACEGRASSRKARPKLKNVDRSSAEHKAVTVNNVTVIITEFQPKRHQSSSSEHNLCLPPSGNRHGHGLPPTAINGCVVENGNHSDSAQNVSTDLLSDERSS